jgi:hypothetical protein
MIGPHWSSASQECKPCTSRRSSGSGCQRWPGRMQVGGVTSPDSHHNAQLSQTNNAKQSMEHTCPRRRVFLAGGSVLGPRGRVSRVVRLGVSGCLVRAIPNILGASNWALGKNRVLVYVREKKWGRLVKHWLRGTKFCRSTKLPVRLRANSSGTGVPIA